MRVSFAPSGAPVSAGRDGTIRTYAVRLAPDAILFSSSAAGSALEGQFANDSTTHAADGAPPADGTLTDPRDDDHAAVPAIGNGQVSAIGNCLSAPQQKRPQLLTCVAVEAVPGMSAPVSDVTVAGAHGSEERLVCGFQVSPRIATVVKNVLWCIWPMPFGAVAFTAPLSAEPSNEGICMNLFGSRSAANSDECDCRPR